MGSRVQRVLSLVVLLGTIAAAGEPGLSGNLRWDLLNAAPDTVTASATVMVRPEGSQDPVMNGLFSLLLPGAGQYRAERYTKAAIFFGAELAFIAYAVISEKTGDERTAEYQRYAEAHWSAERYAKWINTYGASDYGPAVTIDLNKVRQNDFSEINVWENTAGPNKVGFSHQLPKFREQQYYELIGKYYQFKFGWDTYPLDVNGVPQSDNRDYFNNFTADKQIKSYMADRGKANDYYYASSFALSVLVINHALSAVDAIFSTNRFNDELRAELDLKTVEGLEGRRLLSQLTVKVGL